MTSRTLIRQKLPEPTHDPEQAKADLDEYGLCLIADALTPDQLTATRAALVDVAAREREDGSAMLEHDGANQRVWQLLNRGQEFCALAEDPTTLDVMSHVVGYNPMGMDSLADGLPQFLLSNIAANITGPGGEAMPLHADQAFVRMPWPPTPCIANTAWMLDDFTVENGATLVVPGSHTFASFPTAEAAELAVPAEGRAGTAMIFEGRLWHGTGANTTNDKQRHGILAAYSPPWIRQQENFTVSTKPEVLEAASPVLRRLMGFNHYMGWGMIDGKFT